MQEPEKEELSAKESSKYIVHIDNFDGPLDLLWSLIKDAKIDITEISISRITEQYIGYLKLMERMNVQVASDFILMASELLFYKSKALLPGGELDDEYFVPPLPPELVAKLLEYKKFQNASRSLLERYELQADSFTRVNAVDEGAFSEELIEVTLFDLLSAFARVIDTSAAIEEREIVFDEILVSDRITYITELLTQNEYVVFSELFRPAPSRAEIVATFLAVLELAKIKKVKIMQHRVFGEIRILRASNGQT
jgi:segregation and condensation protein A